METAAAFFDLAKVVVGGLIGGAAAMFAQGLARRSERRDFARSLAAGLAAEIESFLDLVQRRDLLGMVRKASEPQAHSQGVLKGWLEKEDRDQFPLLIYSSNMQNIGRLGPVSGDVVRFASQVRSIWMMLGTIDDGAHDQAGADKVAGMFARELELWLESERLGRTVVTGLRSL